MRTFAIGDIHGGHKALVQCLERSNFNKEEDTLIQLGDVTDGWTETYEVVEELLSIKNLIAIKGNHDQWFLQFLEGGTHPVSWMHGGWNTARSYGKYMDRPFLEVQAMGGWRFNLTTADVPARHLKFFKEQHLYYIDSQHRMFVHGGFPREQSIFETKATSPSTFYWDRSLVQKAMSVTNGGKLMTVDNFSEIFLGHTATTNWDGPDNKPITTPIIRGGVYNLDTGGGWGGKLTIMNVDTKEYFQSDKVEDLYPGDRGRHVKG